jgi:hypothetical protein
MCYVVKLVLIIYHTSEEYLIWIRRSTPLPDTQVYDFFVILYTIICLKGELIFHVIIISIYIYIIDYYYYLYVIIIIILGPRTIIILYL